MRNNKTSKRRKRRLRGKAKFFTIEKQNYESYDYRCICIHCDFGFSPCICGDYPNHLEEHEDYFDYNYDSNPYGADD